MNRKKLLPLLVIASMMLSLLPSVTALTAPTLYKVTNGAETSTTVTGGVKSDVVAVINNNPGEAPAGTIIQLFWDDVTVSPYNGVKGLLNSTTVKSSGKYDIWFTVPEAKYGSHYLWIKDYLGNLISVSFTISTKVSLSSTTGQPGDSITTKFYGFGGTKDIRIVYLPPGTTAWPGWPVKATVTNETISTGDGATTEFTDTLANKPIKPGTVVAHAGSVSMTDDGAGNLGSGTINYVTGAIDIIFTTAPASGYSVWVSYTPFDTTSTVKYLDTATTNSVGSLVATETMPSSATGAGSVAAFDSAGHMGSKGFTVGPTITVTPTVSTSGSVIHILGRGWLHSGTPDTIAANGVTLTEPGMVTKYCWIYLPTTGTVTADSSGNFAMDVVLPQGKNVKDDYTITVTASAGGNTATFTDYELTAIAKVTVSPSFGPQGGSVTVSGVNFPKVANTPIKVRLIDATTGADLASVGSAKTLADGTFSKSFSVPAYTSGNYKIKAYNSTSGGFMIDATASFTIGNLVILLSKTSLPAGGTFTLTGSGFTAGGSYNVTMGSKTLVSSDTVSVGGVISKSLTVSYGLTPGVYTVTVFDVATGISVTASMTVTFGTSITLSPTSFPSGFNVSITGQGWPYATGIDQPTFTLFNKTTTGTPYSIWSMDVRNASSPGNLQCRVNGTGFLFGWWIAKPGGVKLSNGVYYVNVTDATNTNFKAQATFTIINKVQSIAPRKSTFLVGDTISFNIQYSFGSSSYLSKLKIYDPSGTLVFSGDTMTTWVKTGDYYVIPYSAQTAGGNPMVLPDDAALGTWTYKWVQTGATGSDTLGSGSLTVAAAPTSQLADQVAQLTKDVTSLQSSVTSIATNVNSLSTAVQTASQTASSAATAAQAASTAAQAASTAAQAASTAATAAGTKADAATAAANAARVSADAAAAAANNLTTLVYGAIGASIVAALAAIVALMQISRKIA